MRDDLHDVSDREMVQLLAAQRVLFDNQPKETVETHISRAELKRQYEEQIREYANEYGVKVSV